MPVRSGSKGIRSSAEIRHEACALGLIRIDNRATLSLELKTHNARGDRM